MSFLAAQSKSAKLEIMARHLEEKSTTQEIQTRFDQDVERFSNLETGQSATIDAPLAMELIAEHIPLLHPTINTWLDLGCGAGNLGLRVLSQLQAQKRSYPKEIHLCDLSEPMLQRAQERLNKLAPEIKIHLHHGDFRTLDLPNRHFDCVLAAAVLHHLREDQDWQCGFDKIYSLLRQQGSLWVSDLISHDHPLIQNHMWRRYANYLRELKNEDYQKHVFEYIDIEDSPRSLSYQISTLKEAGFSKVEILHKNNCFATYCALK